MVARELKPCGTPAAYRRHLRNDEEPCEACLTAVREDVSHARQERRTASSMAVLDAVVSAPPVDYVDPLEDARENLRIVKAAMQDAPHNTIAQLSKRRQELVDYIKELSSADPGVSLKDELAAARDARRSAGA